MYSCHTPVDLLTWGMKWVRPPPPPRTPIGDDVGLLLWMCRAQGKCWPMLLWPHLTTSHSEKNPNFVLRKQPPETLLLCPESFSCYLYEVAPQLCAGLRAKWIECACGRGVDSKIISSCSKRNAARSVCLHSKSRWSTNGFSDLLKPFP